MHVEPVAGSANCVVSGDPKPDGTDLHSRRTSGQNLRKFLPEKSEGQNTLGIS